MMLLSRFWYIVLSVFVGVAAYIVFLAVGQFNRRNTVVLKEGLASDSLSVEWALKVDARRRVDALLAGSVDKGVREAINSANGKEKITTKSREDGKKALTSVNEAILKGAPEHKCDVLFAVDRDGRVVSQIGYDAGISEEFELGGYPAVFDALHGFVRDDSWLLGDRLFLVFTRPIEDETGKPPIGAIVGMKEVNKEFAKDIAARTRTNVAFFVAGRHIASGTGTEGFEVSQLEQITTDITKLGEDKTFAEAGRSETRMLRDDLGVIYARIQGESWDQQAGFAVARAKVTIASPTAFISGADDKDKQSVPWLLVGPAVLIALALGIAFTFLEHNLPLNEMKKQGALLREGKIESLQVARFRGPFREIGQNVNAGIERIVEKGGGTRKPADLESILGPVPAQPAMSAFAFPLDSAPGSGPSAPGGAQAAPPSVAGRPPPASAPKPPFAAPAVSQNPLGPPPPLNRPPGPPPPPNRPAAGAPPPPAGLPPMQAPQPSMASAPFQPVPRLGGEDADDEEATMVAAIPQEVLAHATGEMKPADEAAEWLAVYEDFVRTKKQCNEPTDGLTFEKFQHTLRKNRDALMQRHGCKRVRFSVYVKEGRASLKATPVKE